MTLACQYQRSFFIRSPEDQVLGNELSEETARCAHRKTASGWLKKGATRPPQQHVAYNQVHRGSWERWKAPIPGNTSSEEGWWKPWDCCLQKAYPHRLVLELPVSPPPTSRGSWKPGPNYTIPRLALTPADEPRASHSDTGCHIYV